MRKFFTTLTASLFVASTFATTAFALEHEVEKGENLSEIAEQHNTSVDDLIQLNNLNTVVIQPKQKLIIYPTHIVKQGDHLISISKKYDVSVEELIEWNELKTSLIVIGQELIIKGTKVTPSEQKLATETNSNQTAQAKSAKPKEQNKQKAGKTLAVTATAYTAQCDGCSGVTYTGIDLNKDRHAKVIAVDPNVIPLGSKVYVEGYGYAVAGDIGSAIKGNKIDLHVPTKKEAYNWGVQSVNVTILN